MTSKTKTIEINPSLFTVGGLSRKNKKKKSTTIPLISPNILKNKLLKRIKDHKNKETSKIEKNTNTNTNTNTNKSSTNEIKNNITNYTDEFNDSIEYLQTLSKQKKTDSENNTKRESIQKKTIKKYSSMPTVNLELPDELKETFITLNNETLINNHIDNGIKHKKIIKLVVLVI